MDKEIEVEVEAASGRKDPGWKYARLLNEKDTTTLICIFCDKVEQLHAIEFVSLDSLQHSLM